MSIVQKWENCLSKSLVFKASMEIKPFTNLKPQKNVLWYIVHYAVVAIYIYVLKKQNRETEDRS